VNGRRLGASAHDAHDPGRDPRRTGGLALAATIAVAVASALSIQAFVAARHACWGDLEPTRTDRDGLPLQGFRQVARQGQEFRVEDGRAWDILGSSHLVASLDSLEIHYQPVQRHKGMDVGWEPVSLKDPSSCSQSAIRSNGRLDPPYELWYDASHGVYRVVSASGRDDPGVFDFRRVERPGHVLASPGLRSANLVVLLLAGASAVGGRWQASRARQATGDMLTRGHRWAMRCFVLAIVLSELAAGLSRWT
jgi:hypothetical protein